MAIGDLLSDLAENILTNRLVDAFGGGQQTQPQPTGYAGDDTRITPQFGVPVSNPISIPMQPSGNRQQTWGVNPDTGQPMLVSAGTGVGHTPIQPMTAVPNPVIPFEPPQAQPSPHQGVPMQGGGNMIDGRIEPEPIFQGSGGGEPTGIPAGTLPTYSGITPDGQGQVTRFLNQYDPTGRLNDRAVNTAIDAVTGLPFGIASTLINPSYHETPWGTPFNTGGGGVIGLGGELSRRNLTDLYYRDTGGLNAQGLADGQAGSRYSIGLQDGKYVYGGNEYDTFDAAAQAQTQDQQETNFYAPGTIPSTGFGGQSHVTTPIATSAGFIPGTEVISGNTDLALQQNPHLDLNNDGQLSSTEVNNYQAAEAQRQAQIARQAEIDRLAQQDRALAEAARQREAELERQRIAEIDRQQRQAAEAAQRAAQEAENRRRAAAELAASNAQRESEGRAPQQGSPVTDRHGNAVRDSSGGIVTDRPTQRDDNGGGGGGGGRVICNELRRQGYFTKDDILLEYKYTREYLTPAHVNGYHKFAIPMVKLMRKGKMVKFWHHIAKHRLNAIRFKTGETDKRDVLGSIYGKVLEGISWTLGQFSAESDWSVLYNNRENERCQ